MSNPIGRRPKPLPNARLMATVAAAAALTAGADIAPPRPVIVNEQPRRPVVNQVRVPASTDAGTKSVDGGSKSVDGASTSIGGTKSVDGGTKKFDVGPKRTNAGDP